MTDDLITRIVAAHRFMIAAPLPGISVERPDAAGAPSPAASKSAPSGPSPVPPAVGAASTVHPPPDDVSDALDWLAYGAQIGELPGALIDLVLSAYYGSRAYSTRCDDEANDDWQDETLTRRHMRHYQNCNCLGDAAECCDPMCCRLDPADPATAPPRHAVTKADQ